MSFWDPYRIPHPELRYFPVTFYIVLWIFTVKTQGDSYVNFFFFFPAVSRPEFFLETPSCFSLFELLCFFNSVRLPCFACNLLPHSADQNVFSGRKPGPLYDTPHLFPFSQGSKSCAAYYLMSEDSSFTNFVPVSGCLRWEDKLYPFCFIVADSRIIHTRF